MSIIPMSSLSRSDLSVLGNNLTPRPLSTAGASAVRRRLAAVNRSLAAHGEAVDRLYRRPGAMAVGAVSPPVRERVCPQLPCGFSH